MTEAQFKQNDDKFMHLKNEIILDTGSTIPATFMDKELVTDIQDTKFPLLMNTNTGTKVLNKQANVIRFGKT